MLTEQLGRLKKSLIDKGDNARSANEDKLLEELVFLDKDIVIPNIIEKGVLTERIKSYGGSITCPHCGLKL